MPWIIDYQSVFEQLRGQGLCCAYPNSGAFGFLPEDEAVTRGWIGGPDMTIKPALLSASRWIAPPLETNLARLAADFWQRTVGGRAWLMPASHWSYELNHGSRDWMPAIIEHIGLDPGLLQNRTNGAAIEFAAIEAKPFQYLLERLLEMLMGSDFMLAFPRMPVVCTVHHHKQLWWCTTEPRYIAALDELAPHPLPENAGNYHG